MTYSSGMPGFSPSEWVDEKLKAARYLGDFVHVVTSISSSLESCEHQSVYKIPSFSDEDFRQERAELSRLGVELSPRRVFSQFAGRVFDRVFTSLAGTRSDGRWSWAIPASLKIYILTKRLNPDAIIATGGPSASQFAATLASMLPGGKRPVLEFQDPFVGREMALSPKVLAAMGHLNRLMLKRAEKYVAVSLGSLEVLKSNYPKFKEKLMCIYPFSSPQLDFQELRDTSMIEPERVEFLHAGTLYGSRNLNSLFAALDRAYASGEISISSLQITNLGSVYAVHEQRSDFQELELLPRTEALIRASQSQVLLLIQHSDDRSLETIPFKLYDYLNIPRRILVLGRNPEIKNLLSEEDFYCEINDAGAIIASVCQILADSRGSYSPSGIPFSGRPEKNAWLTAWDHLLAKDLI